MDTHIEYAIVFFMATLAIYPGIFLFICFIAWLSSRELRTSSEKLRHEESALKGERDSLEQRIAERTSALLQAEQDKLAEFERTAQFGELSQGLFHDLMNPLSALSLSVEELSYTANASPEIKKMLDRSVDISKRMKTYMESVRRCLERPGMTQPVFESNILHEIDIVRDILGYKARMAGVHMTVDCPASPSLPVHPVRVHQIFLNLMSNAIDADSKNVAVRVAEEGGAISITVKDDGLGMNEDRLKTVFTSPSSSKKGGTGIGLATVKRIVEDELRGKIKVESTENSDTTFVIEIPIS